MATSQPSESESLPSAERAAVAAARRVVVKIGTGVLCDAQGQPARERLARLVATVAGLRGAGREVVLVTSGAVGVGRGVLAGPAPRAAGPREAWAAVGQSLLIALYQRLFAQHGVACAQVLLGQRDLHRRGRAVRLMRTLDLLLRGGAVPILNENDATGGDDLPAEDGPGGVFSDNDRLAALVAGALGAELLVFLTDVDGLYDRAPGGGRAAVLLARIDRPDELPGMEGARAGGLGRGGMRSKVEAALIASRGGCGAVIASGVEPGAFSRLLAGETVGTWFPASGRLAARERWIAFSAAPRGALHLDAGAQRALLAGTASLLAAGVVGLEGTFRPGEVVELRGPGGRLVGRALSRLGAEATRDCLVARRAGGRSITLARHADIVLEPIVPRRTDA